MSICFHCHTDNNLTPHEGAGRGDSEERWICICKVNNFFGNASHVQLILQESFMLCSLILKNMCVNLQLIKTEGEEKNESGMSKIKSRMCVVRRK